MLTDDELIECSSRLCVNRNREGSGCVLLRPHLRAPRSGCRAINFMKEDDLAETETPQEIET